MTDVKPTRDRVLVRRAKAEEMHGGIVLPENAREKPQQAEVIAVGSGRVLDDGHVQQLEVQPGNQVLIGKWSGAEVPSLGEDHLIIREDDILAILRA